MIYKQISFVVVAKNVTNAFWTHSECCARWFVKVKANPFAYEFFLSIRWPPHPHRLAPMFGHSMYLQYSIAFETTQVKFYTIKTPVAKSFVQMIMTKGFPLRDRINFKIRFVPCDFADVGPVDLQCAMCVLADICALRAFPFALFLALMTSEA